MAYPNHLALEDLDPSYAMSFGAAFIPSGAAITAQGVNYNTVAVEWVFPTPAPAILEYWGTLPI